MNATGTAFNGNKGGIIFVRDERPTYNHSMIGIPNTPAVQFQPVMLHGKSVCYSRLFNETSHRPSLVHCPLASRITSSSPLLNGQLRTGIMGPTRSLLSSRRITSIHRNSCQWKQQQWYQRITCKYPRWSPGN